MDRFTTHERLTWQERQILEAFRAIPADCRPVVVAFMLNAARSPLHPVAAPRASAEVIPLR